MGESNKETRMKTTNFMLGLVFLLAASIATADEVKFLRMGTGIVPEGVRGAAGVQVFYETDKRSFVCVNVLTKASGFCGSQSVKECYSISVPSNISFIDDSLRNYEGVDSTTDYLYSLAVKDEANHKRCQISVAGKLDPVDGRFDGDKASLKEYIRYYAEACTHITLKCF